MKYSFAISSFWKNVKIVNKQQTKGGFQQKSEQAEQNKIQKWKLYHKTPDSEMFAVAVIQTIC